MKPTTPDDVNNLIQKLRKENKQQKALIKELFQLWEDLSEAGELSIGEKFSQKYEVLKMAVKQQGI
jgi:hypothetical protein